MTNSKTKTNSVNQPAQKGNWPRGEGVYFEQSGDSPPALGSILFIHGSESHTGWFSEIRKNLVNRGYRTISYDRKGWGKSTGRRGIAEDINELLDQLGRIIGFEQKTHNCPLHLVGLSWGGLLVTEFVRQGRATTVSSVSALVPGLFPINRFSIWDKLKILLSGIGFHWFMIQLPWLPQDFSSSSTAIKFISEDPLRVTKVSAKFLWQAYQLQRKVAGTAASSDFQKLQIVLGQEDEIVSVKETKEFAAFAKVALAQIQSNSHGIVIDAVEETADAIHKFAASKAVLSRVKETL